MNKDDQERFWNLIIFKTWATNKERDQILPWVGCFGLVILIIVLICAIIKAVI